MVIIVIKDKEESMVLRITDRDIVAKLKYFKAISKESYSAIFKNLFSRDDIEEKVTKVTHTMICKSTNELQKVAEHITPNGYHIIDIIKVILLKLNDIPDRSKKDGIALTIREDLLNIKERVFLPKLLRSV